MAEISAYLLCLAKRQRVGFEPKTSAYILVIFIVNIQSVKVHKHTRRARHRSVGRGASVTLIPHYAASRTL